MIKLILPTYKYKKQYYDLITTAKDYGDFKEMGNAFPRENETFNQMLNRLKNRKKGINISNRDVPSTLYWIMSDNILVGTIDLRHELTGDYEKKLGHIAYYIKPNERNKGYATQALSVAIKKYSQKNINSVFISSYSDNYFSIKVIKNNGGILNSKFYDKDSNKEIYKYVINNDKIIPSVVWLTTNRTCNNDCNWCYAHGVRNNTMNFKDLKKYVNEFSKNRVKKVILIGGEPTIYKNIIKTVQLLTDNGIYVSMASNGRRFSDWQYAKKIVDAGLKSCNISIKGFNEEEYLKNTNSIGFHEMVNGYKNLKKLGINVSTSFVLCDMNLNNFDNFLDSFIKNNLDNISFQFYKPSVDKNVVYDEPTVQDLATLCEYAFNKIKKTKLNYSFEMSIPLCCLKENILNEMIEKNCISSCCHITKGKGIIFDSDFNILPCNHFISHPLNSEKIRFNKVFDFWNSETPNEFRKIVKTYPHKLCSKCLKWQYCGGGCFIRWLSSDVNEYINDKYCERG